MLYDKLPVVLLSTLASEKNNSTNSVIAEYILTHRETAAKAGIKDLAEACHAGTGSVSRFCREIGLQDFSELKALLRDASFTFEFEKDIPDVTDRMRAWKDHVCSAVETVSTSIDPETVRKLCEDLHNYKSIYAFGMMKGQSAALCMQADMLMMGKHILTSVSYADQIDSILHASKEDLIIIFSYTGSYFDYQDFRAAEKRLILPKIWMICGTERKQPWFADGVIRFSSMLDQRSHPYQLLAAESLIMQEYAYMYHD